EGQDEPPLGIRNEIDRFMQKEIQRDAYAVFLRRLQRDLLETLPTRAEQRQFAQATGRQRVAAINDLLARAAKEKKWDDAKTSQMKEKVLEMLLGLDQGQERAVPQPAPEKQASPKDAKPKSTTLSDENATAIKVWIGAPL